MSSVRTNWHLGDLELPDEADPMGEIAELQSGNVINLTRSQAELESDMMSTLRRENRIAARGTECSLKWKKTHRLQGGAKHSCFTCKFYRGDATGEFNDERAAVCRIGREQEALTIELDILSGRVHLDDAYIAAVEADIDVCAALAEASHIDSAAELAEAVL